jgi:hypothetical protein
VYSIPFVLLLEFIAQQAIRQGKDTQVSPGQGTCSYVVTTTGLSCLPLFFLVIGAYFAVSLSRLPGITKRCDCYEKPTVLSRADSPPDSAACAEGIARWPLVSNPHILAVADCWICGHYANGMTIEK